MFGLNYSEISDGTTPMKNIILDRLKKDITLICREKSNHDYKYLSF